MRLIDADVLKCKAKAESEAMPEEQGFTFLTMTEWITDKTPTAEYIIQCKDCKHWIPGFITDNDDFVPPKCARKIMLGCSGDDYCSCAERKTDEVL